MKNISTRVAALLVSTLFGVMQVSAAQMENCPVAEEALFDNAPTVYLEVSENFINTDIEDELNFILDDMVVMELTKLNSFNPYDELMYDEQTAELIEDDVFNNDEEIHPDYIAEEQMLANYMEGSSEELLFAQEPDLEYYEYENIAEELYTNEAETADNFYESTDYDFMALLNPYNI